MVPRNSTPGGYACIWLSKWVGTIPIKTERTQIHFLRDALIAVASLDRKVPILAGKRDSRRHHVLQRDIARIGGGGGNKLSNVRSFYHFAIGRGLNFLQYGNNQTNFFGEKKKGKMKLSGVSFF